MRTPTTFARSRVARRILMLFVVCALVPVATLAVLSLNEVRTALIKQSEEQLTRASKEYGLDIYERLLVAQRELRQLARLPGAPPADRRVASPDAMFSSLTVVGSAADPASSSGEAFSPTRLGGFALAHLDQGESVLMVDSPVGAAQRILLIHLIDANPRGRLALVAELNPSFLWGSADDVSDAYELCVLAESGQKLFCSQPSASSDPASDDAGAPQGATVKRAMVVGQWQLFLKPKFYTPYWTVIATEPVSVAMVPIATFSRLFIEVILLSLLLVLLLSAVQIRRTLTPLGELIGGIRRLGGSDFSHRLPAGGNDEFGELASAFNNMVARLGRERDTLKVLSRIDEAILSKVDIDPVFGLALGRMLELSRAAYARILVLEPASAGEARTYTLAANGHAPRVGRSRLTNALLQRLAGPSNGFWLEATEALALPPPEGVEPGQRHFVLPIADRGKLCAFAWLGIADDRPTADETLSAVRDLCDRVGVALSAAARDEQLIYQVRHDDLTGLPNRLLLKERLSQEIASSRRAGRSVALLYVDLDRFKDINDSLGHTAGDELLDQTARRMRACIRESDMLARLGGDEFAIVLPQVLNMRSVTTVAENMVRSLSEPFLIGPHECFISASIGIAICPVDGGDSETLLKKADTAMYRAKDGGRGRFVYFEERMNEEAVERMALEQELRQALARNELMLHYQPQFDLRSGRIAGAEALLRWQHPSRGLIPPELFLGVAEDTGLIEEIGRRVLVAACAQYTHWRSSGLAAPRIAVNVSVRQIRRGDLVQTVEEALRRCGAPASALEIEVTESLFMEDSATAVAVLHRLREMGVQVAIDDFGAGYSSMSYLKRLPVDVLKVDRSFIADMTENSDARAIAKAIVSLARTLNKSVVAEGVETEGQLALLKRWRCHRIQGYYFSPPLAPERFAELLLQCQQTLRPRGEAMLPVEALTPP